MNFGDLKGFVFDRVLLYFIFDFLKWFKKLDIELVLGIRLKFYVVVICVWYSVGIVVEDLFLVNGIFLYEWF